MSKCSVYDEGKCTNECSYCVITDCENGNGYYDSCGNYVSYGSED